MTAALGEPLVEVRALTVEFRVAAREWRGSKLRLRAVDDVSLTLRRGETTALVGESGCGKTTFGRALVGLYQLDRGTVVFDGIDMAELSSGQLRRFRRRIQMIFQDPYASLNPRMKVQDIVEEPLRAHRIGNSSERSARVRELLALVGLPSESGSRFPHAFSGGQRQRIGIARALALHPEFIVADEPVSALDVSIQAQIVNLLKDLQDQLGLTLLVISHDLAVVRQMTDRVAVMYLGSIVEIGARDDVFQHPLHPYTNALLSVVSIPDPALERAREVRILSGEVPSPIDLPSGCRFRTRCPFASEVCERVEPQLKDAGTGHLVACHLVHPPQ